MFRELEEKIEAALSKENYTDAILLIDGVLSNQPGFPEDTLPDAKANFSSYYLEIADVLKNDSSKYDEAERLVNKSFGVFNQLLEDYPDMITYVMCNRARGHMIKFDIGTLRLGTQAKIETIFEIKDSISEAIRCYWLALKEINNEEEIYNVKNNLANALSRVGRAAEAISLFRENIISRPIRWQSYASLSDILINATKVAFIPETASLYMNAAEYFKRAIENGAPTPYSIDLEKRMNYCIKKLEMHGFKFNEDSMNKNKDEEILDYAKHSSFRRFSIQNDLTLSEHALYCKCRDASVDNLMIGLQSGSKHISKTKILPIVDKVLNRVMSEFAFARFQYYQFDENSIDFPSDMAFSSQFGGDAVGYKIEQLRSSYRIAYGILDKIANALLVLFEINKENNRDSYYESVFDMYKEGFSKIKNTHLMALYSISLDLNKDTGSLRFFKKLRNEMEHGFLMINQDSQEGLQSITLKEMEQFTLDLLKLTRSAIFSFAFLVRTETIA